MVQIMTVVKNWKVHFRMLEYNYHGANYESGEKIGDFALVCLNTIIIVQTMTVVKNWRLRLRMFEYSYHGANYDSGYKLVNSF